MGKRGPPKGTKVGGRAKGTRNKATLERIAEVARVVDRPLKATALPAKEVLEEAMMHFRALAAKYQPKPDPIDPAKMRGDEDKFERFMKLARDTAADLAPYQSPRLAAVAVQQLQMLRPEELNDDQLRAAIQLTGSIASVGSAGGGTLKTIN